MNELPSKFIHTRIHAHTDTGRLTRVSIAPRFNLEEITLALAMINHKQPQLRRQRAGHGAGNWQAAATGQDRTRCYVPRYGRGRQDARAKSNNM